SLRSLRRHFFRGTPSGLPADGTRTGLRWGSVEKGPAAIRTLWNGQVADDAQRSQGKIQPPHRESQERTRTTVVDLDKTESLGPLERFGIEADLGLLAAQVLDRDEGHGVGVLFFGLRRGARSAAVFPDDELE